MDALGKEALRLLQAATASSTKTVYQRGVDVFHDFRAKLGLRCDWPASVGEIVSFISHESLEGRAASTIQAYIAGLSYYHKLGGWPDPTKAFIVCKLLEGCKRLNSREDLRLPITFAILADIFPVIIKVCKSEYEGVMFQSAFTLAFFGYLRVSEFATQSKKAPTDKVISLNDISLHGVSAALQVRLRFSKTDQRGNAVVLKFNRGGGSLVCPVAAMERYLAVRPRGDGPLFIHMDKTPLTQYQVGTVLKTALEFRGYPSARFSSHSFRIGAATSAAMCGFSSEEIQQLGRWKSCAYQLYIRPQALFSIDI